MSNDQNNTINLKTAQSYARKWRKEEGTYNAHHDLHAFFIPKDDLIQLLDEGVDGVRAYLGVDANNVEKLMIVGTRYNSLHDTYDDMLPDAAHPGQIYDFTRPCPPFCGFNSSLNNLPPVETE